MKVKEYRKNKGYTQEEVAQMLQIKQGSYSKKENGKRAFTAREIKLLKEILEISYEELLN